MRAEGPWHAFHVAPVIDRSSFLLCNFLTGHERPADYAQISFRNAEKAQEASLAADIAYSNVSSAVKVGAKVKSAKKYRHEQIDLSLVEPPQRDDAEAISAVPRILGPAVLAAVSSVPRDLALGDDSDEGSTHDGGKHGAGDDVKIHDDENVGLCVECREMPEGAVVCCDGCPRSFCLPCLKLENAPAEDPWKCGHCD